MMSGCLNFDALKYEEGKKLRFYLGLTVPCFSSMSTRCLADIATTTEAKRRRNLYTHGYGSWEYKFVLR